MKLTYTPFQIFRHSRTPAGLYARQKWLEQADSKQWKADFQQTVGALSAGQLPDGSWHNDTGVTIEHLFGLHLTVRTADEQIEAALDFLLGKIDLQTGGLRVVGEDENKSSSLAGLPFTASRRDCFVTAAALFLASIFGRANDSKVLAAYQWLAAAGVSGRGRWFDDACTHNILRAMVVHPVFSKDKAVGLAVKRLKRLQSVNGYWGSDFPFYQNVNALAHLDIPQADSQLEKAFKRVREQQKPDGTWSEDEPEWNTFLVVHALKNKHLL